MTLRIFFALSILSLLPLTALAQQSRISSQIDRRRMLVLKGNVHPSAQPRFDEGPVDPSTTMDLVTLMLKPSESQQAALEQLLAEQQNPASPNYHRWLTPEEYAERFGVSRQDLAKIVSWLQSEGFAVDDISRGANWIVFHGTAAQIGSAFHTEIHRYLVQGERHFANATQPSVPAAIGPLVIGILGLDDFKLKPMRTHAKTISDITGANPPSPEVTTSGGTHYLAPDDLATIYDIAPLYRAGFDGTGQKIAIAGGGDVDLADIRSFRSTFNLSAKDPQLVLVPGSQDPGTKAAASGEADLDIEWSGAVARNATIVYAYATDPFNAALYAISQNLAPVLSVSFGACETQVSTSFANLSRVAAQQGNVQGITWLAASGDSGAADCDLAGDSNNATATHGISVNFPSSIPEVTAVGGTQFNEGNGSYWNTSNSSTGSSALSYIPEAAWNESSSTNGLGASGGGVSALFSKPSWQTGPGVPSANARAVPDLALAAAANHDGYKVVSGGSSEVVGGTSAAAPATAGIIALLNQYQAAHGGGSPGQGNINPVLYRLAQVTTGVFHDITSGNNIVPCAASAAGCSSGSFGYSAAPGYDLVTGLGSIDANNLVTQWNKGTVPLQQPFHLQPFSGDVQAAAASSALPQPIVVSAQDANGVPVPGVTVTFSVALGGGSVSPATAVTNASGLAQTQMTLGPTAGTQIVLVSANQFASTGIAEIAGATPALGLAYAQAGNNQTAPANTTLPTPLTLTVADSNGTVLPDIPVAWLVTAGGGSVNALATVTDNSGKISANWTLGSLVGSQTVQAIPFYYDGVSLYNFHGTTFTATASTATNNPVPALTSISPTSAAAGGAGLMLTVVGKNFINGSVVQWNGAARPTTFVSSTQVTASISSSDIANAGTAQVTVLNPSPGGGVSTSLAFNITSNSGAPSVPSNGILNGAGFDSAVAGLSPGAIASIFGTNLSNAPASGVQPGLVPGTSRLFVTSNGTTVTFDGVAAPLFFVSPTQLNVQVPFETAGKTSVQVVVSLNGSNSPPVTVRISPSTPALFTVNTSGKGAAVTLNQDGSVNSAANPATAGTVIQLFATGLGAVSPSAATGTLAATSPPLALSVELPTATIGGVPASVQFSGLAPGFVGLWQVNVLVPSGAGSGAVPLLLRTGGQNANPVTVFVQ